MLLVRKFWERITGAPMSYWSHLQCVAASTPFYVNYLESDEPASFHMQSRSVNQIPSSLLSGGRSSLAQSIAYP